MKHVELHPALREFGGTMGNMVFRRQKNGKTVVAMRPVRRKTEITEGQAAHRERFKQAVAYGKFALSDASVRALYEAVAQAKNVPIFSLTVADFFNAPTIDILDLSAYNGQAGDPINVSARDDFGVTAVYVYITDEIGTPIENGSAMETVEGSGRWVYTATTVIPTDTGIVVKALATDRPGGTTVKSETKAF